MSEKKEELWVNIYRSKYTGHLISSGDFYSKESALKDADPPKYWVYIKTVKVYESGGRSVSNKLKNNRK